VNPSSEAYSGSSSASALGEGGKIPRSHCGKAGGSRPETARRLGLVVVVLALGELLPAKGSHHPPDGVLEPLTDLARPQVTELVPHELCAVFALLLRVPWYPDGDGAVVALALSAALLVTRSETDHGDIPTLQAPVASTMPSLLPDPADGETPSDETPLHDVAVGPFCLDITEVTVQAYSGCEACERPAMTVEIEGLTPNARAFWSQFCDRPEAGDHPINCVDWQQARAYCGATGKRLPTEAEWELAARGRATRTSPWGQAPPGGPAAQRLRRGAQPDVDGAHREGGQGAVAGDARRRRLGPFDGRRGALRGGATPAGVLDLSGNVWEWTESHSSVLTARRTAATRGGGWDTVDSQFVRAAHRRPSAPTARGWSIGFRCAKTP
jgi:formylglycine-generating enzyme